MRNWIIRQNIDRFERMLNGAVHQSQRDTISSLLEKEKRKLTGGEPGSEACASPKT